MAEKRKTILKMLAYSGRQAAGSSMASRRTDVPLQAECLPPEFVSHGRGNPRAGPMPD
jgi:hypothetical protein